MLVGLGYIRELWCRNPSDTLLPFVHFYRRNIRQLGLENNYELGASFDADVWQAIRTVYPWLAKDKMFSHFLTLSFPRSLSAILRIEFEDKQHEDKDIGFWIIGQSHRLSDRHEAGDLPTEGPLGDFLAGEEGTWYLYDGQGGDYVGPDPVAGLLDPDNSFSWTAKAWLEPLAAADAALHDFLAGTASLDDVFQRTRAKMVLS